MNPRRRRHARIRRRERGKRWVEGLGVAIARAWLLKRAFGRRAIFATASPDAFAGLPEFIASIPYDTETA